MSKNNSNKALINELSNDLEQIYDKLILLCKNEDKELEKNGHYDVPNHLILTNEVANFLGKSHYIPRIQKVQENEKLYSPLTIAKTIVHISLSEYNAITKLGLRYVLYEVWKEYYKETNEFLFNENFVADQLGVDVLSVKDYFYCWAGSICSFYEKEFKTVDNNIKDIIRKVLKNYSDLKQIHTMKDNAWEFAYNPKYYNVIPFDKIINVVKKESV